MKPFLLLLLAVHFISAKHQRRHLNLNQELQTCFDHGTDHGQTIENSCHKLPKSLSQKTSSKHLKMCTSTFTISCLNAHKNLTCNAGIRSAKLNGNCKHDHHSESFKSCCHSCNLGIEIQSSFGTCSESKNNLWQFDALMSRVVEECCDFEKSREIPEDTTFKNEVYEELFSRDETKVKFSQYTQNPHETQPISTSQMCSKFTSLCNENEICVDTFDSFNCTCKLGFSFNFNSNECEDIDECILGTHNCSKDETCKNTIGSFECKTPKCAKGFVELSNSIIDDDIECVDVDECLDDPCDEGKICKNLDGTFECVEIDVLSEHCEDGHTMVERECVDRNECREEICGKDEICTNLKGSYRCEKIECGKYYKRFLKSHCRRNICSHFDTKCKKLPSYYSHFFKVVEPWNKSQKIFSIEPFSNQIFTDFKAVEFDNENFKIKEVSIGAEIWMKKAPIDDVKLKIEIEVLDKFGKYKNKQINVYHVYVEK